MPPPIDQARWFAEEVQPHEPALRAYADAPLSEIIADFNRYNQHKLVVADARLAERRFGGTFPAGDYASLVQLLEKTFGVVVERRERETLLRLP